MFPLPAPNSPGGIKARGPSEQAACGQGCRGMVVETLRWDPVLVRRVDSLSPLLSWRRWAGPPTSTQAQLRPQLSRLIGWKFTGLQNGVTDEIESLHSPPAHSLPGSPPHLGDPRQKALQFSEPSKLGYRSSPRGKGEGLLQLISQSRTWPRGGLVTPVVSELRLLGPPQCQGLVFLIHKMRPWTQPSLEEHEGRTDFLLWRFSHFPPLSL